MDRNDAFYEEDSDLDITFTHEERASQQLNDEDYSNKIHVTINKEVKLLIDEYAASDTSRELGGVLIGGYEEKSGCYEVYIKARIKAHYSEASKSNIKFTHQTWEYIDRVKEEYYPDDKMVGWFHTHPGFGVFLSDYDLFIQNNFFEFPFQVAYVVDPVKGGAGFFGKIDGEIMKIKYNLEENVISTYRSRSSFTRNSGKIKFQWILNVFLLIGLLYISYLVIFPSKSDNEFNKANFDSQISILEGETSRNIESINDVIKSMEGKIENIEKEIEKLRKEMVNSKQELNDIEQDTDDNTNFGY